MDKIDFKEIQNFIRFAKKIGLEEISVELGDLKIKLKANSNNEVHSDRQLAPVIPLDTANKSNPIQAPDETKEVKKTSNYKELKSPMVGTYYGRSSPDKPNFVNIGDTVKKGQVICIIEAMKIFNEIEAEEDGKIVDILVKDETAVEFDQVLFRIDPS